MICCFYANKERRGEAGSVEKLFEYHRISNIFIHLIVFFFLMVYCTTHYTILHNWTSIPLYNLSIHRQHTCIKLPKKTRNQLSWHMHFFLYWALIINCKQLVTLIIPWLLDSQSKWRVFIQMKKVRRKEDTVSGRQVWRDSATVDSLILRRPVGVAIWRCAYDQFFVLFSLLTLLSQ